MTQDRHGTTKERQQTQPDDHGLVDGAILPVFAFGNEVVGGLVPGLLATGNDVCGECHEGLATGSRISPVFEGLLQLDLQPHALPLAASRGGVAWGIVWVRVGIVVTGIHRYPPSV
ncbi:hypothetical protein EI982_17595 [Haloplanus rallus]|uniref:Uncharacterized protein n=1 Tax=Haloplanus rallus TaxID=1816183 RepID=A0A6B9FHP9_9EURY|nr:hypothetical protein EI982_17595 [Haloplanus rallus]